MAEDLVSCPKAVDIFNTVLVALGNIFLPILVKVSNRFSASNTDSSEKVVTFWRLLDKSIAALEVTPATPPVDLITAFNWERAAWLSAAALTLRTLKPTKAALATAPNFRAALPTPAKTPPILEPKD